MASRLAQSNDVSYLPEDVIENILSLLSVKELGGLSVLSKRFRNSWKFCRNLSFDRDFARNFSRNEYKNFINDFFASYTSTSADAFKLYFDATDHASLVSDWTRQATSLKVKELDLDFSHTRNNLILNYDLINSDSLRTMRLVNCELHLPITTNGLRNLGEVTLQNARVRPAMVEALFLNCSSLRALTLIKCSFIFSLRVSGQSLRTLLVKNCSDVHSIAVNSPSLRTFHYHGKITEFYFHCNLPFLSDVIFEIAHPRSFHMLSNGKDVMESLAFVTTLTVTSTILEGLTARYQEHEYKNMEFCLQNLKEFHLIVTPESFLNPSDVIIFLNKCPHIERVFINLGKNAFGSSFYWDHYGKKYLSECQIIFPFLKYIKIKGFTLKELSVTMARYLLKNAIHLQCLALVKARIHYFPEYYNSECLRLGVLSNAEIEIYDYHKDISTIMPKHLRNV